MKFWTLLKVFLLSAVLLTGCKGDEEYRFEPYPSNYDHLSIPAIKQGTFPETDLVLNIGEKYVFSPEVLTSGDVYYQWYMNGDDVSTASSYTFTADQQMKDGILILELENENGKATLERKITVRGDGYAGKYLIVNEGWFGHEYGSINAYNPQTNTFEYRVVKMQNGGRELGVTSQSATMWNGDLYVCSKDAPSLAVFDPQTMEIKKQITGTIYSTRQAYEFIGLNERYGVVTSGADFYRVDLETLEVKWLTVGNTWQGTGSGIVYGDKLLLNVNKNKVYAIDLDKLTAETTSSLSYSTLDITPGGGCRFVKAADGNVYTVESVSGVNNLVRIKPDLSLEKVEMNSDYSPSSFSAYSEASFCGTGNDNNFFYAAGNKIYKCSFDNPKPSAPMSDFAVANYVLYGAGIRVNSANNEIVATYAMKNGDGTYSNSNILVRFDGDSGQLLSQQTYGGYWFPSTIIFNN